MHSDPFDPISRRRLLVYVCLAAAIIIAGCGVHIYLGGPLWRVALLGGMAVAMFCVIVGGTIWLTGGQRSSAPIGPRAVRPSKRFLKAFPYMIAAIVLLQLVRLLGLLGSK